VIARSLLFLISVVRVSARLVSSVVRVLSGCGNVPCYHPLSAWRGRNPGPSGKVGIVFRKEDSCGVSIELPCGQCIGCRLERSRQWAGRCMHEASLHECNSFVTLTYSDSNLPDSGSLVLRDFQLFCKRLRKRLGGFRFFHCGEYGERLGRPHYHACLFGVDFPDRVLYNERNGVKLYESPLLNDVWGLGFATVGDVTFESAAYVARYVCKKVTGESAGDHYGDKKPEYVTMSRRPGIGREWFEKFSAEVYPSDEVISRGRSCRPPRFYDSVFELAEPSVFDVVKRKRVERARVHSANCTPERLRVRERCTNARISFLRRSLEEG